MKTRKNFKEALHTSLTVAVLLFSMLLMSNNVRADYAFLNTGSGSHNDESSAYLIQSTQDLIDLASYVNSGNNCSGKYFKLQQDLDFTNTTFTAIGSQSNYFEGTFDGNGYSISNITIVAASSALNNEYYVGVGLFGGIQYGTIINLGLIHATISNSNYKDVGVIVGYDNNCTITDCYVINSTISGYENVGGIVGYNVYGHIYNCYSKGNTITGTTNGGIIGYNQGSDNIQYCYTTATSIYGYPNDATSLTYVYNSSSTLATIQQGLLGSGSHFVADVTGCNGGYPILGKQKTINIPATNPVTTNMKVGAWNLWGSILTNSTANVLNNNHEESDRPIVNSSTQPYDIAAVQYNYSGNNWNTTTYLLNTDGLTNGEGYFVYPLNGYRDASNNYVAWTNNGNFITVSQTGNAYIKDIEFGTGANQINLTNTGATTTDLTQTGRWFALSNPYPITLSVENIINATTGLKNIQGSCVYTYDPTITSGSNWITDATYIVPGQGFMVALTGTSTSLTGKLSMNQRFSSKAESLPTYITFTSQANNTTKEAFATMNDNAENGFDDNDAYVLISSSNEDLVEPYFLVDNHAVMNNIFKTMPYYTPINFHASKVSNTNLTVSNIPNDVTVSIIDLSNGNETALENGSTFSFVANEGENTGRFVAKFGNKNVGIDNNAQANDISFAMYPNPATTSTTLMIDGLTNNAQVIVNDIQGREIKTYTINKQQSTLNIPTSNLASGVYYVRVVSNDLTKTEKLVVK